MDYEEKLILCPELCDLDKDEWRVGFAISIANIWNTHNIHVGYLLGI